MNTRIRRANPNSNRRQGPSARTHILSAWRGIDLTEAEALRAYHPKSVSRLTEKLVADLNLDRKQSETEIPKVWADSIDPRITAHAQPTNLRNGTLFVAVDNSTWLHEILRYHRHEILTRLQNAFGETTIKRISFRLG